MPVENSGAAAHAVSIDALRTLATGITGKTLRLVFLNACGTEEAGRVFSECGVGAVVCIAGRGSASAAAAEGGPNASGLRDSDSEEEERGNEGQVGGDGAAGGTRVSRQAGMIEDECALTFSSSFYLALSSRKSVLEAFNIGLASVRAMEKVYKGVDYEEQASMFRLLGSPAEWDSVIFGEEEGYEAGGCYDMDPPRKNENLPSSPEDFEGRNVELYKLVRLIRSARVTTLAGSFGMGKSTIAVEGARYLWYREAFSAIVYVKVGSVFDLWEDVEDKLRTYYGVEGGDEGQDGRYYPYQIDVELLRRVKDRSILIILDGAESIIDKGAIRGFRNIVKTILEHTKNTKVIITTSREAVGRLHKATESVFEIPPLQDAEIAKILMFRAPVLRRGYRGRKEFLEGVSRHSVVKEHILGNPFRVGLVATLLQRIEDEDKRNLDGVMEVMERVKAGGEGCSDEVRRLVQDLLSAEIVEDSEDDEEAYSALDDENAAIEQTLPIRNRTSSGGSAAAGFLHRRTSSNLSSLDPPQSLRRRSRRSSSGSRHPGGPTSAAVPPLPHHGSNPGPGSPGLIPGTPPGSDDGSNFANKTQLQPSFMMLRGQPSPYSATPGAPEAFTMGGGGDEQAREARGSFGLVRFVESPALLTCALGLWFGKLWGDKVKMETREERLINMGHMLFDFAVVAAVYYLHWHRKP